MSEPLSDEELRVSREAWHQYPPTPFVGRLDATIVARDRTIAELREELAALRSRATAAEDDWPKRGEPPVLCTHCSEEIEAYGVTHVSLVIAGSRPYLWRHIGSHVETCTRTYEARPYDDFAAHRQIDAAAATERTDG